MVASRAACAAWAALMLRPWCCSCNVVYDVEPGSFHKQVANTPRPQAAKAALTAGTTACDSKCAASAVDVVVVEVVVLVMLEVVVIVVIVVVVIVVVVVAVVVLLKVAVVVVLVEVIVVDVIVVEVIVLEVIVVGRGGMLHR